jgi:hypothetical protein
MGSQEAAKRLKKVSTEETPVRGRNKRYPFAVADYGERASVTI